jgi:DNA-binding transcriptional ArsR family regulator
MMSAMRLSPLGRSVDSFKALAHPGRLRVLAMLQDGPLSVCQITAVLHLAASTVSAHLTELRRAGLLEDHKEGRFVSCALSRGPEVRRLVADVLAGLEGDEQVGDDRHLASLLRRLGAPSLCAAGLDLARLGIGGTKGKGTVRLKRPETHGPDRGA